MTSAPIAATYVLRFTTAGVDSPTATPLPSGKRTDLEGPVPTESPTTPEPTQDPRITPTTTPVAYQPTDWPRDISAIIECPTEVPGIGEALPMFGASEPPMRQTFATLEAAQAALDFPLYQPGHLPAGAVLDGVQIETTTSEEHRWAEVSQMYRLPDGAWLELTQMVTTVQYASAGWGQARYAPEACLATVVQNTGYVVQRLGWWVLDWKVGDVGLVTGTGADCLAGRVVDRRCLGAVVRGGRKEITGKARGLTASKNLELREVSLPSWRDLRMMLARSSVLDSRTRRGGLYDRPSPFGDRPLLLKDDIVQRGAYLSLFSTLYHN